MYMKVLVLLAMLLAPALALAPTSGSKSCPNSGVVTVATTSKRVTTYTIQAPITNTGKVCLGDSTISTTTGTCLQAGMADFGPTQGNASPYDLSTIFMACSATTDVVTWRTF